MLSYLFPSLENIQRIKYLGIIIDHRLTFQLRIHSFTFKVRKLIYIFKILSQAPDVRVIKMLYALCQSVLLFV